MRRLVILYMLLLFIEDINAQVVENPVFDRTDVSQFRVKKVIITKDTTFVYCTYSADENTWANISDKMYLENVRNGERFPIVKVLGIPFGPEKRLFAEAEEVNVVLFFPHVATDKINIVESEREAAFNIYGIDLTRFYMVSYTSEDIHNFFDLYKTKEKEENWRSALGYTQKQLEACNYVEGIQSFASACSMYNMLMVLLRLEEYVQVIEWGKRAIDILRDLPQDSIYLDVLARAYGNVGTAYHLLNEHDTANDYMELSLATRRLKDGVGTLNYEEYLSEMAKNYFYEENYPKALLYGKEIVDVYAKKYSENPYKYECVYINSLNSLCGYYQRMGKTKEAVSTGKRAMELIGKGGCDEYDFLKLAISHNLGGALLDSGEVDEGISLLESALSTASKDGSNNEHGILSTRLQLASAYLCYRQDSLKALYEYESILKNIEDSMLVGKYDYRVYKSVLEDLYEINRWANSPKAMRYLDKVLNMVKEREGDSSIAFANFLLKKIHNLWVPALLENKGLDSLVLYTKQATDIIKRHINNSLFTLSKNERQFYWKRYEDIFTWFIPTISGILNTDFGNSLAYDAALFYKGLLLSSEKEFRSIIQNSSDDELIRLYQDYTSHLIELEKQYSIKSTDNNIDSLNSLIHDEEYLLSQKVARFSRRYKGTDFSWKEVKEQLKKDDIAIEIVSYHSLDSRDIYYDAYVIGYDFKFPKLIHLCSEEQLKSLTTDSIDYKGLSSLFWGNEQLQEVVKEVKNIYFSAIGMFNIIGIEFLPIAENRYIFDRFNLYRLSSTRELCLRDSVYPLSNAYLYGGLDYNCITEQPKYEETFPNRLPRSAIETLAHRGGFEPLMGSMQEVEHIQSSISRHKIKCVVLSGSEGTEESLKNLSGSSIGILHISTHGMYVLDGNDSVRQGNNYRFIISTATPNVDEEDISLSQSFLVMSGGNALIYRDSISFEGEDGILTALEISHLSFTDLDLVVLSACETALGSFGYDGVYGLQRGFKKAGANTILMSLNKVDDEATRILMVEFYRNLMNGKNKRQSLQDAQQYLRKIDNGKYDDPKYWASFIMLDGLN